MYGQGNKRSISREPILQDLYEIIGKTNTRTQLITRKDIRHWELLGGKAHSWGSQESLHKGRLYLSGPWELHRILPDEGKQGGSSLTARMSELNVKEGLGQDAIIVEKERDLSRGRH